MSIFEIEKHSFFLIGQNFEQNFWKWKVALHNHSKQSRFSCYKETEDGRGKTALINLRCTEKSRNFSAKNVANHAICCAENVANHAIFVEGFWPDFYARGRFMKYSMSVKKLKKGYDYPNKTHIYLLINL